MAYIGNTPADKFLTLAKQSFTTSATTSYTLDSAVSSTQDIALFINNVRQSPVDAYTVSGTALTLTSATAGTDEMYCVYLGKTVGTVSPASDSVTTAMIQANAVTNAKLGSDINATKLTAGLVPTARLGSGTASSSTVLYGDQTYKAEPSGGLIRTGGQSTHSNAGSYSIDNVMTSTYRFYRVVGVTMADNTSASIQAKLRSWDGSSGADLSASSYVQSSVSSAAHSGGGTTPVGDFTDRWNAAYFYITADSYNDRSSNQYACTFDFIIYRPDGTAYSAAPYVIGNIGAWEYNGGSERFRTINHSVCYNVTTTNLGGISFYASSGNMSMIDCSVYGMVAS